MKHLECLRESQLHVNLDAYTCHSPLEKTVAATRTSTSPHVTGMARDRMGRVLRTRVESARGAAAQPAPPAPPGGRAAVGSAPVCRWSHTRRCAPDAASAPARPRLPPARPGGRCESAPRAALTHAAPSDHQGGFAAPAGTWQRLVTFLVVMTTGEGVLLPSGEWRPGGRSTPCSAQDARRHSHRPRRARRGV